MPNDVVISAQALVKQFKGQGRTVTAVDSSFTGSEAWGDLWPDRAGWGRKEHNHPGYPGIAQAGCRHQQRAWL